MSVPTTKLSSVSLCQDLHNVVHLLKPNGVLMENLSTPSFAEEQVALFKDFLGDVSEEVSFLIE